MRFQACFHRLQELPEALHYAFVNYQCDHRLEPVARVDHHYHLQVAIIGPEVAWLSPLHRLLRVRDIVSHKPAQGGETRGFDATVMMLIRLYFRKPSGFGLPQRRRLGCAP